MSIHWILKRSDAPLSSDSGASTTTLHLHPQYIWSDEYDWTPIAQSSPTYALSGAMHIQQGVKKAGRPITLEGTHVWLTRAIIKTLQQWASMPELTMTLSHPDGRTFNVMFRRPFIDNVKPTKPIRPNDELATDWFKANIHLMTF